MCCTRATGPISGTPKWSCSIVWVPCSSLEGGIHIDGKRNIPPQKQSAQPFPYSPLELPSLLCSGISQTELRMRTKPTKHTPYPMLSIPVPQRIVHVCATVGRFPTQLFELIATQLRALLNISVVMNDLNNAKCFRYARVL
jgi:hypothetical protein